MTRDCDIQLGFNTVRKLLDLLLWLLAEETEEKDN